jgi:hypothetical protein
VREDRDRLGDRVGGAVVQQAVPHVGVLPARDEHADLGVAVGDRGGHEFRRGAGDPAVGALDDVERQPGEAELAPRGREILGLDRIEVEVHRAQLIRCECSRVLDCTRGGRVELVDQHDDDVATEDRRLRGARRVLLQLVELFLVLLVEPHQRHDHDGHEHDDEPSAVRELRDGDDHVDRQRQECADPVDDEPVLPVWLAMGEVVLGHAGLREREAGEHADRVERDQPVDLGVRHQEHRDGGNGEEDDPVREHESVAALGELARHEVVLGVEAREPRKVGEARVGREHEDQHRARLQAVEQDVAELTASVHEASDLADHRRRPALVRHRVRVRGEDRQPEEHRAEQ